ncbi:MAG TPA: MarR family transcriptional regulator [Bacillales bacterium]|nr:MarR family transcriptional regulator [Bacillales bacterium]
MKMNMELSSSQVHLLRLLEQNGPLKMSQLAEQLQITLGGVTLLANRMVKAGWIDRQRGERDRRIVRLQLTDGGAAFLEHLTEARNRTFARYFNKLNEAELAQLKRLYEKILDDRETEERKPE